MKGVARLIRAREAMENSDCALAVAVLEDLKRQLRFPPGSRRFTCPNCNERSYRWPGDVARHQALSGFRQMPRRTT
jgi:hypothetical protein